MTANCLQKRIRGWAGLISSKINEHPELVNNFNISNNYISNNSATLTIGNALNNDFSSDKIDSITNSLNDVFDNCKIQI